MRLERAREEGTKLPDELVGEEELGAERCNGKERCSECQCPSELHGRVIRTGQA